MLRAGTGSLPTDELLSAITSAGEVRRTIDAILVDLVLEVAQRRDRAGVPLATVLAERDAEGLVARYAGLEPGEARVLGIVADAVGERRALTGELLPPRHPLLAEAFESGSLSLAAARLVASTLGGVAETAPERLDEMESILVEHAPQLGSRELRSLARQVRDRCDPDGAEPREDLLRARSGIRIAHDGDGLTRWIVTMHPEAAAFLQTAVDARTAPRRQPTFDDGAEAALADDPRTLPQRRLDALVDLARESLTHDTGRVAGAPVTVGVTMTLEALRSGIGTATLSGVDEPISAATARRLAADAEIIPIVLGSRSEVLDFGRKVRIATAAQRRALEQRDGGCVWGDCPFPPSWCETAHIRPWWAGGPTDLANLLLLCPFHHRCFDRDGWELIWRNGAPWLVPPAHLDASRRPRRGGRTRLVA